MQNNTVIPFLIDVAPELLAELQRRRAGLSRLEDSGWMPARIWILKQLVAY